LPIAIRAAFVSDGLLRKLPISGDFSNIPSMGGTRMITKKMAMAER
jgi:hypothetical protein